MWPEPHGTFGISRSITIYSEDARFTNRYKPPKIKSTRNRSDDKHESGNSMNMKTLVSINQIRNHLSKLHMRYYKFRTNYRKVHRKDFKKIIESTRKKRPHTRRWSYLEAVTCRRIKESRVATAQSIWKREDIGDLERSQRIVSDRNLGDLSMTNGFPHTWLRGWWKGIERCKKVAGYVAIFPESHHTGEYEEALRD